MQAALMLGSKSRVARGGKLRKLGGRLELPSNVATKEIAPFPRYPPESWCAQGRAAWLERGRRCSVQESQQQAAACHRRWVKGNRIQDASLGGSSDDEDFLGVLRGPSTFANAFLYVGLGTIALGLVIAFVGTGEKGFKTVELRLIGPSLIGLGFICCLLRILFCICPSHCISTKKNARKKNGNKIDADHTTSLLRGESKRVSIARGPGQQPTYPITHKRSNSKMLNEGMEALRQIATTSLFMQNEQKPMTNRIVPIIKEPENANVNANDATNDNKKTLDRVSTTKISSVQNDTSNTSAAIDNELPTNTAFFKAPSKQKEEVKDCSVKASSGFSNIDLSHSRNLHHQNDPSVRLLSENEDNPQQMETSLMFIRNPNLTNEMLTPQPLSPPTSVYDASITTVNSATTAASSLIPPVHGHSSVRPQNTTNIFTGPSNNANLASNYTATFTGISSSITNPASTYAAALAAAISSRANTDRAEGLVRGPLGMPMHVLAASSSTYALPSSAPNVCLVKPSTSAPLSAPSTAPSTLGVTACETTTGQQAIPGQVVQDMAFKGHALTTPQNLKPSATSMLSSTYSASSSAHSQAGLIGSTSFTSPNNLPTTGSKYEPELLLSPAKLGQ